MRFDVDRFNKLTNGSSYYRDWDNILNDMMKITGRITYEKGRHSFFRECKRASGCCVVPINVMFDDSGQISVQVYTRAKRTSGSLSAEDVESIIEEVLRTLSTVGDYGLLKIDTED